MSAQTETLFSLVTYPSFEKWADPLALPTHVQRPLQPRGDRPALPPRHVVREAVVRLPGGKTWGPRTPAWKAGDLVADRVWIANFAQKYLNCMSRSGKAHRKGRKSGDQATATEKTQLPKGNSAANSPAAGPHVAEKTRITAADFVAIL